MPVALHSAGAQLVGWVLGGLHLWLVVVALGADPAAVAAVVSRVIYAVCDFALAGASMLAARPVPEAPEGR